MNPEAIAWYVLEAQRLLEDQRHRAESLRTRGGEVAGFGALFLALIGSNAANILQGAHDDLKIAVGAALVLASICLAAAVVVATLGVIKPQASALVSASEISHYSTDRFLREPDLWRVQVRSLRALERAIRNAEVGGNETAEAITASLYAFLAGLLLSVIAIGTLILESI